MQRCRVPTALGVIWDTRQPHRYRDTLYNAHIVALPGIFERPSTCVIARYLSQFFLLANLYGVFIQRLRQGQNLKHALYFLLRAWNCPQIGF